MSALLRSFALHAVRPGLVAAATLASGASAVVGFPHPDLHFVYNIETIPLVAGFTWQSGRKPGTARTTESDTAGGEQ